MVLSYHDVQQKLNVVHSLLERHGLEGHHLLMTSQDPLEGCPKRLLSILVRLGLADNRRNHFLHQRTIVSVMEPRDAIVLTCPSCSELTW